MIGMLQFIYFDYIISLSYLLAILVKRIMKC
jgi:hypothetical protein